MILLKWLSKLALSQNRFYPTFLRVMMCFARRDYAKAYGLESAVDNPQRGTFAVKIIIR